MEVAFKCGNKDVEVLNSSPVSIAYQIFGVLNNNCGINPKREYREKEYYRILHFLVSSMPYQRFEGSFEGKNHKVEFIIEIIKPAPHLG